MISRIMHLTRFLYTKIIDPPPRRFSGACLDSDACLRLTPGLPALATGKYTVRLDPPKPRITITLNC